MTKIKISDDEKYIIEILNIKQWNPLNRVTFDTKGELIKERLYYPEKARFSKSDIDAFKIKLPDYFITLIRSYL